MGWTVAGTSAAALVLTCALTPSYNGVSLRLAEDLAGEGETVTAVAMLYAGPQECSEWPKTLRGQNGEVEDLESAGEPDKTTSSNNNVKEVDIAATSTELSK